MQVPNGTGPGSGGGSVLCWLAAPVAMFYYNYKFKTTFFLYLSLIEIELFNQELTVHTIALMVYVSKKILSRYEPDHGVLQICYITK